MMYEKRTDEFLRSMVGKEKENHEDNDSEIYGSMIEDSSSRLLSKESYKKLLDEQLSGNTEFRGDLLHSINSDSILTDEDKYELKEFILTSLMNNFEFDIKNIHSIKTNKEELEILVKGLYRSLVVNPLETFSEIFSEVILENSDFFNSLYENNNRKRLSDNREKLKKVNIKNTLIHRLFSLTDKMFESSIIFKVTFSNAYLYEIYKNSDEFSFKHILSYQKSETIDLIINRIIDNELFIDVIKTMIKQRLIINSGVALEK